MKRLGWAVFFFVLVGLPPPGATPAAPQAKDESGATGGRVRTYYVAAEEVDWDYAPLNVDMTTDAPGKTFGGGAAAYTQPGPKHIGRIYRKAIYREYTDGTFTTQKPRAPQDAYLEIGRAHV